MTLGPHNFRHRLCKLSFILFFTKHKRIADHFDLYFIYFFFPSKRKLICLLIKKYSKSSKLQYFSKYYIHRAVVSRIVLTRSRYFTVKYVRVILYILYMDTIFSTVRRKRCRALLSSIYSVTCMNLKFWLSK